MTLQKHETSKALEVRHIVMPLSLDISSQENILSVLIHALENYQDKNTQPLFSDMSSSIMSEMKEFWTAFTKISPQAKSEVLDDLRSIWTDLNQQKKIGVQQKGMALLLQSQDEVHRLLKEFAEKNEIQFLDDTDEFSVSEVDRFLFLVQQKIESSIAINPETKRIIGEFYKILNIWRAVLDSDLFSRNPIAFPDYKKLDDAINGLRAEITDAQGFGVILAMLETIEQTSGKIQETREKIQGVLAHKERLTEAQGKKGVENFMRTIFERIYTLGSDQLVQVLEVLKNHDSRKEKLKLLCAIIGQKFSEEKIDQYWDERIEKECEKEVAQFIQFSGLSSEFAQLHAEIQDVKYFGFARLIYIQFLKASEEDTLERMEKFDNNGFSSAEKTNLINTLEFHGEWDKFEEEYRRILIQAICHPNSSGPSFTPETAWDEYKTMLKQKIEAKKRQEGQAVVGQILSSLQGDSQTVLDTMRDIEENGLNNDKNFATMKGILQENGVNWDKLREDAQKKMILESFDKCLSELRTVFHSLKFKDMGTFNKAARIRNEIEGIRGLNEYFKETEWQDVLAQYLGDKNEVESILKQRASTFFREVKVIILNKENAINARKNK